MRCDQPTLLYDDAFKGAINAYKYNSSHFEHQLLIPATELGGGQQLFKGERHILPQSSVN